MERQCFDEFLDAGADVALVAPGVYGGEVGGERGEEGVDLGEAGGCFFGDGGGEGGFYGANSVFVLLVFGYGVLVGGWRTAVTRRY